MSDFTVEARIGRLEKETQRLLRICLLQFFIIILIAVCLSAALTGRVKAESSSNVLRARGLVIEDQRGHARVILGAPVPAVHERKRQDSLTDSMIFLDEDGNDRLTLGEGPNPKANGKILHRIATFFGVLIHDNHGDERGGYGWLTNGRAVLTLDRPGLDAWAAVVDDKTGFAGMRVEYPPDVARDSTAIEIGTQANTALFRLIDIKESNRAVLRLGANGLPAFQVFDEAGRPTRDLLR